MPARGGVLRLLARALLWLTAGAVALSLVAVLALRWVHPLGTAFMLHAYLEARGAHDPTWHLDYRWVPYEGISRHAKLAVIASEDQKFAFHPGFDFEAIDQAIKERERGRRLRGASTISQQVAKNLFLWPGPSFVRKGLEAYLTTLIELCWPKQRILEVYLNVAEFGPGIYGVGAAAPRFFRTDAAHLSQAQSALLAAVLPSPRKLRVDHPSAYLYRRQAWIIEQMNALGGASYIRDVDTAGR
ncbi:MAG: monofunctional biosynthetic peptidoglycan transglycosylase [Proteobacteria bacterium]|nr:monofunctional biosynthetic peptidoglycan transglycosylase [Pseudomonadota bacterium]